MKVIVTRPRDQTGPLVERIEALGHEVVACPLIEIEPIGPDEIDASSYDWLIVTSPNGAREAARRLRGRVPRVAAVGPGTAEVLRAYGIEPSLVPRASTQDGLLDEFPRDGSRVLFAAAEGARPGPIDELGADFLALYRTSLVQPKEPPHGDIVVLASGSAARSFAGLGIEVPAVTIGPETTAVARQCGIVVAGEAERQDLDGLVAAVERVASAPWRSSPS